MTKYHLIALFTILVWGITSPIIATVALTITGLILSQSKPSRNPNPNHTK